MLWVTMRRIRGRQFLCKEPAGLIKEIGHRFTVRQLHNIYNDMARKSVIIRSLRVPKFKSRVVRRCNQCGRKRGYMQDFDLCRICFREQANEGHIPGIKKSSW